MSRIPIIDNTKAQTFSLSSYNSDCKNLRIIANKTIGELQKESKILIFPPNINETNDKINNSFLFNMKEKENFFTLDTGNIMGFLGLNNTEIDIRSRFSNQYDDNNTEQPDYFLHYMLEKTCHINLTSLDHTRMPSNIFDLLPFLFPYYLNSALKQGIYKEYKLHKYNNVNLHGTIDINRHIKNNIPANGKIAYNTREYSYDNPITQLIRHTIEYLRSNRTFKNILNYDNEIINSTSVICNATPSYNRMNRDKIIANSNKPIKSPYFYKYRDLQKICRMILLRDKIRYASSENKFYGIIFDGSWLWEEYLSCILLKLGFTHPDNKKRIGGIHPLVENVGKFFPDFYLPKSEIKDKDKLADIIIDAKYKDFDSKNPAAEDLAQIIAYIHVMDANIGYFIYPSKQANHISNSWNIKPFRDNLAGLGTIPFYIPQRSNDYIDFKSQILLSENTINQFCFSF